MITLSRRALVSVLGALPFATLAQGWPERPLRLIVPSGAGGTIDVVARGLAERLAAQVGRPVVVDNRSGAAGAIGMESLAKAAPDGHTLAFSPITPLTLNPVLGKVPYDPEQDFTPVASVMVTPLLLLATQATGARDLPELLRRARDFPDMVRWASSGPASLGHLMLVQLELAARVRIVHVPYKAGGQQVGDALGAHFEVLSVSAGPGLMDHVRSGRLRPLAVGAPRRLDSLPNVPTLAELGFPRANLATHFGVFAPGNLPVRLLDRLNSEVNTALAAPELRARMQASENLPTGGSARDFARQVAAEADSIGELVRQVGIHGE
jgi:tripartite-type tricarboxylate transporter receptor subunit TctC